MELVGKKMEYLKMKAVRLDVLQRNSKAALQIHLLGLHEKMRPGMVDRPKGTGDYLFMLFHSEVRVRSRDGETEWPPQSLMIWTPEDGHYYGNAQKTWNHSWLHCAGRDVGALLRTCRVPVRKRIEMGDPSLMEHFLLELAAELGRWNRPDPKIMRNLLENFLRAAVRQSIRRAEPLVPKRLLVLRSHLEQHFTERIRLTEVAREAGWSAPHLCSEFRRYFGIPILQFVQQLRMSRATYLLRDHNHRIGEIAAAVGYPDLYAFSKMFKRYMGASPRNFRELHLQSETRCTISRK
jgi:AraC family transcriptional regulator, arabinose operon regulatory protein